MLSRAFLLVAACFAASSEGTDVPIFCGTVESALKLIKLDVTQEVLKTLQINLVYPAPLIGPVNLTVDHVEFGDVTVGTCQATAADGEIDVNVGKITIDIKSFRFSYEQQNWPHKKNSVLATGIMGASLEIAVDTTSISEKKVNFKIDSLDLKLAADAHKWLYAAAGWLADHSQKVIGTVVQLSLRAVLSNQLKKINQEGSCAVANDLLQYSDTVDIGVKTLLPVTFNAPTVGEVEVFVNVSSIVLPKSISCGPWAFNGTQLDMAFDDANIAAEFAWAYRAKNGGVWSRWWHNSGQGSMKADAGCKIDLDLLKPSTATIEVHVPEVQLDLHAEKNDWLYRALNGMLRPVARKGVEWFGGRVIKRVLECLADPTCHVPGLSKKASASSYVTNATVDIVV